MEPVMYVLVRKDLSKSQQAVQAGHALAQYLIYNPNTDWKNGTLVYLTVQNLDDLKSWINILVKTSQKFYVFTEPDLHYQETALAVVSDEDVFKDLLLL